MNLYAIPISTIVCIPAESAAEAARLAAHYAGSPAACAHEWEIGAPEVCDAESLPAGWSKTDRVVGMHAITVGEVLAEAA